MPRTDQVNWQPISQMPLIASMITASLNDTHEHLGTLTKAKDRPHVLDDATIDRVEQAHTKQMQYINIHTQQDRTLADGKAVSRSDQRTGPHGETEPAATGGHHRRPRAGWRTAERHDQKGSGHE